MALNHNGGRAVSIACVVIPACLQQAGAGRNDGQGENGADAAPNSRPLA